MAIRKVIEIKVKDKQAVKAMKSIGDAVVDTKNDIINLERELIKLERQLKKTNAQDFKGRRKLNRIIDKTKQSIKEEKNALKSLTLQKSVADKATRRQIKSNRKLNQSYFKSKEAMTDVNRLTAEMALKIKAVKNIFLGSINAIKKFATAQRLAFTAGAIGVFLIALTAIIFLWDSISEAISGTNKKLQKQLDLSIEIKKTKKLELALVESLIKLTDKQKIANEDLKKERIEIIKSLIIQNDIEIGILQRQANILKGLGLELSLRDKIQAAILNALQPGTGDKFLLDKSLAFSKEFKNLTDVILAARKETADFKSDLFDFENPDAGKGGGKRDKVKFLDLFVDDEELAKIEREKKVFDAELKRVQAQEDALFKISINASVKKSASEAAFRDLKTAAQIKAFEEEQFIQLLRGELDDKAKLQGRKALNDLTTIFGEQSKIGKAAAITGIIIDQVSSASRAISALVAANAKAVAASPTSFGQPWVAINTISTGLAIAAGAIAAKKAISEIGGGGGGISSTSKIPVGGQSAPSFNVVGTSGTNQLAQSLASQDQPIQAFVVGSNVTTQQALDRNIIETATIG